MKQSLVMFCVFLAVFLEVSSKDQDPQQPHMRDAKKDPFGCEHHRLLWMHIPKTSSTFCMAIQHLCCKEQFEHLVGNLTTGDLRDNEIQKENEKRYKFDSGHGCISFQRKDVTFNCPVGGHHEPLQKSLDEGTYFSKIKAITMIREPRSRIVSSYLDGMHHEGFNNTEFNELKASWETQRGSSLEVLVFKLNAYANHPNMIGCQVKMLNGYDCSDPLLSDREGGAAGGDKGNKGRQLTLSTRHINQSAIAIAINRLQSFYFVGVFDQYVLSLQLLHKIANISTIPSVVELFPIRTTNAQLSEILNRHVELYDPYDSVLYTEANRLFQLSCIRYGLSYVHKMYE